MRSKVVRTISYVLLICTVFAFSGCSLSSSRQRLSDIKGDYKCEFRVGKSAGTLSTMVPVETDVVFDEDMFIELYNEGTQYNPFYLKYHVNKCDLRIAPGVPEIEEMLNSEINISAVSDDDKRSVSVFEYDSELYFFVLCMGKKSEPDEQGYYYMEVPEELADYWKPLLKEVREDAEEEHRRKYGSFTMFTTFSFDRSYYAEVIKSGDDYMLSIGTGADYMPMFAAKAGPQTDFRGMCWENDSNNLWIQTVDGVICYSLIDGQWAVNEDAVKPDYILEREE